MLFEFVLVIPSLFHFASGQSVTPDPLEELFGNGLDKKVESWSSNLLFGDANFNEISNALDSAPPSQRNNRRGNSQRDPLPMGLSFLNGGESLQGLLAQDTIPSPVDSSSTGENGLFNIPPMPNFDQLGLENVLDKFLPIDGSVRLPPPSNDPIVHSRDNVPIPSIGQLGLDSSGLFGQSLFSSNAGSLSGRPTQPSRMADATPSSRNNNINNRNTNNNGNFQTTKQMNTVLFPTEVSPTIPTSPAQPPTMAPGRSEQQKLLDQQIWDSIIPPLPENRKPVEVFPQNDPTPKPKKNKKIKPLLPLLPPSPSRKSSLQSQNTKNKDELVRITSDNILNNIPSIDQLTFGGESTPQNTPRPSSINSDNLIESIPSIDELGMDIFGNNSPFLDQGKAQKDVKPTPTAGDIFQFPDQFSGSNRQLPSGNEEQTKQSVESSSSKVTEMDNNTSSLENLWNILLAEVPGLPGIISGEDATTPKPKTLDIEAILGISASDIDAFNANQDNSFSSQDSKPQIPAPLMTTKSPPKTQRTTPSPKVYIPQTTLPPVEYIQTTTATPPPPVTVYIPPPTTQPVTTPKPAVYNLPELPMTDIFLHTDKSQQATESSVLQVPTFSSLEKTTSHLTIDFGKKEPNNEKTSDSSKNDAGKLPLPFEKLLPPLDFSSLDTKSDSSKAESKSNINSMLLPSHPDTPFTTPFPFHLVPTIPEGELQKPKFEDLGIFNINHEPDPFINFLPQEPKTDHNAFGETSAANDQASKRQSEVFGLDSLMGDKQTTFFDTFNEPKHDNNIDFMSNGFENLNSNSDLKNPGVDSNSPYKPLTTTTKEELSLPGLGLLQDINEETTIQTTTSTMAPSTTVPEIPMLDLSLLGGINTDITNHGHQVHDTKEKQIKVTINSNDIKDVPPLDFDIFKNMNGDTKADFTTPLPIPTLPALPSLGNINTVNNDGHEAFGRTTFESKTNVDPLKQIIDSGPSHSHTPENSVPISNSLLQNSHLFPFVAPTSEASKHFVFQDQSNGGNIRTHPPPGSFTTTPKPTNQDDNPRKPNIIVIDIQKTLPDRTVTQTKPTSLHGLQNTDNIASIESVSNSQNIVTLHQGSRPTQQVNNFQQVTQTPPKVTTPAWLASTILAIRNRLNQLRAMRNNAQNNANNNVQNPGLPRAQNNNQGQNSNVPSSLPANNQRNNLQQIQILLRNRLLQNRNGQNSNLQNSNNQPPRGTGFTPRMNINFRGFPQNQAQQQQQQQQQPANFQQIGIPQFQIRNVPNQFNQANQPPIRQPANIRSPNIQQVQSNGIQSSQTQQAETTQNDLALVRERIRQRIQQVLRTQILRHLLARHLQTLRNNQTPNNAQTTQNQPIWRAPSSTNGMNVMNANNAINLIRQARQRTLTATQQQRQQQPQQNQPAIDLSRNIFERFPNTNFQNPGLVPVQFRPQQPAQRIDLSRLFQNNRGTNFNNRFAQPFQQLTSNRTNGNRINTDQGTDLALPPSELALRNLRNFNLQRAQRVQQGTASTFRPNQNLVVQRTAIPVSEAFQQIERLRAQNRDIAPFGNINSNLIQQTLMERFRNGLPRFQPVQNVPHTVFNRQRILVPINRPLVGLRNDQNITRRPNLGQTSAPPGFSGPPGGWPWGAQQNSDK